MGNLVHTSHVRIVQDKPPVRRAYIEKFPEPFYYGVHSGIADFYKITPEVEYPATLDHIIGGVAG